VRQWGHVVVLGEEQGVIEQSGSGARSRGARWWRSKELKSNVVVEQSTTT
jgi:hypothetical protein